MPRLEKDISYSSGPSRRVDVVELTRHLVRISSDRETKTITAYVEELARRHRLETYKFPTLNRDGSADHQNPNLLVGRGLGALPRILFSSHIDTVAPWRVDPQAERGRHDPFAADVVDGTIVGRGSTDSKGGAAAQLAALINRRSELSQACALLLTAREESDLRGLKSAIYQFKSKEKHDPTSRIELVCASGSDSEYATGSRGILEVEIVLEGRTGHTARPPNFRNVVKVRDRVATRIEYRVCQIPEHPILGRANMFRTTDKSGFMDGTGKLTEPINQIPNWASMKLGGRLNGMRMDGAPLNPQTLEQTITRELDKYKSDGVRLSEFKVLGFIESAISDPERVKWVIEKAEKITGRKLKPWNYGERGLEETIELVGTLKKKPALIVIGPGKQDQYHQADEYVEIRSLEEYEELYGDIASDKRFKAIDNSSTLV